jgi:hypothetical protein
LKEPVSDEEEARLYKTVENLIRARMICTEQVPTSLLHSMSIGKFDSLSIVLDMFIKPFKNQDKGKLIWNVEDTFELILRLPSNQNAWNIVTLNILISQPELERQGSVMYMS